MPSMSDYKKRRKQSMSDLTEKLDKLNSNQKSYEDDRLWKIERDKAGNGYAVIRFLDAPEEETAPWVRLWHHGFQGPGGWYIENSLTSIGQKDPVSEHNTSLWNSGVEADKDIARQRKRKLNYYSNIYVVEDSLNSENEGKVFLFRYGKKIFEKITGVMNPEFQDETPINPFDLWEGANFKIKMRQVDGFPNYDKSEFTDICPLAEDEKKLEEVWKSQYSLSEIVDEKNFKSYAELESRFNTVIAHEGNDFVGTIEESTEDPVATGEKADETLDYFKKLAEQE